MITAETIRRITHFDSHGLPVVSLYLDVPVEPAERAALDAKVNSLLDQVRADHPASDLNHAAKTSMRRDVEHIQAAIDRTRRMPGCVAIFSCAEAGLFEEIRLPRSVPDRVVADSTPWVRPMLAMLD